MKLSKTAKIAKNSDGQPYRDMWQQAQFFRSYIIIKGTLTILWRHFQLKLYKDPWQGLSSRSRLIRSHYLLNECKQLSNIFNYILKILLTTKQDSKRRNSQRKKWAIITFSIPNKNMIASVWHKDKNTTLLESSRQFHQHF